MKRHTYICTFLFALMTSTTTGSFVMIKKKTTKYISGNDMENIPCSIKVKIAKQRQTTK